MGTQTPKRHAWLITLATLAVVGAGFWFAYSRGWLDQAGRWVRGATHRGDGSAQSMPGMDMGSMQMGEPSDVPGYAVVTLPGEVRQRIGVTIGRVERAPLLMSVRTVGIVRPDETKVAHIHLRTEGWVQKLEVGYTGQTVKKDAPLLSIYSPSFLTTQVEYLNARRTNQADLARLARQRLELWGVSPKEINELNREGGEPRSELILRSPLNGTVLEKEAFVGQYVKPETELYTIADLSTVWVQAKVYEYELPHVELNQPATVTLPSLPDKKLPGKVVFVEPTVEEKTRTVQVRVELDNKDGRLKPGSFAHIEIEHTMGEGLLVPTSAVIRTGERDVAFRVESEGRFVPVEVKVSAFKFGDRFHVLEGLKVGDRVVTSANFLIDSESRLRAGGGMNMPGMEMGDMKGTDRSKSKGAAPADKGDMKGMDHSKMKH